METERWCVVTAPAVLTPQTDHRLGCQQLVSVECVSWGARRTSHSSSKRRHNTNRRLREKKIKHRVKEEADEDRNPLSEMFFSSSTWWEVYFTSSVNVKTLFIKTINICKDEALLNVFKVVRDVMQHYFLQVHKRQEESKQDISHHLFLQTAPAHLLSGQTRSLILNNNCVTKHQWANNSGPKSQPERNCVTLTLSLFYVAVISLNCLWRSVWPLTVTSATWLRLCERVKPRPVIYEAIKVQVSYLIIT